MIFLLFISIIIVTIALVRSKHDGYKLAALYLIVIYTVIAVIANFQSDFVHNLDSVIFILLLQLVITLLFLKAKTDV